MALPVDRTSKNNYSTDTNIPAQEGNLQTRTVAPWLQKCATAMKVAAIFANYAGSLVVMCLGASNIVAGLAPTLTIGASLVPVLAPVGILMIVGSLFAIIVNTVLAHELLWRKC
ncbi:MAG: hypothetical protein K2P51_06165 [Rhabdochlamydiaceae bacterium]|nr:hypothetical protein [Rhabdochlamydiaceae bacterium]